VTEYVGFEHDTLTNLEWTGSLYTCLRNLEEFSHRGDGVSRLDLIFNYTVLFVKVKIALTNVVCGPPRADKHHDFEVTLLTLFICISFVDFFRIVGYNAIREAGAVCIVVVSIRQTRAITWYRLLPPIGFIVTHGIRVTIVVTDTCRCPPAPVSKFTFGTTQRKPFHL
jgi:hypothetical protein